MIVLSVINDNAVINCCPHPSSAAFLSALSSQQQVSHTHQLMGSNISSTPPAQDNQVVIGSMLSSRSSNYLVESFLGQGAFGKVAKCMRLTDMKTVAIKMMKNEGSLILQAKAEVGRERCLADQSLTSTFL